MSNERFFAGWADQYGQDMAGKARDLPLDPNDLRAKHAAHPGHVTPPNPRKPFAQRGWTQAGTKRDEKGKREAARGGEAYKRATALDRVMGKVSE